ncbi:hypothetical protein Daesc_009525 [Daldinia eschscholtzii]|uniref:Uncharacterized protein n=1 Tax=Daldinia eschscholtzii TaxID=292717 RepID=A0AAX6M9W6_9PEZI
MSRFKRLYRYMVKSKGKEKLDEDSWWENRVIPYMETKNIHTQEQLDGLIGRYVPTVKAVGKLCDDTVFVAMAIKPASGVWGLIEVSLALLPTLDEPTGSWDDDERPNLGGFALINNVKVMSFKINMISQGETAKLRANMKLVKALNKLCENVPQGNLALVGFSLQRDIEDMGLNFVDYSNMFPCWIDLSRMIETTSPHLTNFRASMGDILNAFGYVPLSVPQFGVQHVLTNDAVQALAILDGLQYPSNIYKLVLRERKFPDTAVEARLDSFRFMPYKVNVHCGGSPLPRSINSAQKLTAAIQDYRPIGVAADVSDPLNPQFKPCSPGIHATGMTRGCVCFKDKEALENFIKDYDGKIIDGVKVDVDEIPHQPLWKLAKNYLKTKGTSVRDHLEGIATSAKESLPRLSDLFHSPADANFPWCPNPEDAPPGYYDDEDFRIVGPASLPILYQSQEKGIWL